MSNIDSIKWDEMICRSCAYAYCYDHKCNVCKGCHPSLHDSWKVIKFGDPEIIRKCLAHYKSIHKLLEKEKFNLENEDMRIFKEKYFELKSEFENLSMPDEVFKLLKIERDAKVLI